MIKIVIYEDNPQLREGLTMLLESEECFTVLASYRDCSNILKEINQLNPDIILMDIDMPCVNGIEGLKKIRSVNSDVKILMLTVFDDNKNVFEAISNGANGYILKKTQPEKIIEYIKEAQRGGAPMTSAIASQVLKMFASMQKIESEDYNLSSREKEVLQFLVDGYSYKMIASDMFISIDTVRSHIKKIYDKMHVNSKSEAVAKVFKDRIL